MLKVLRGVYGVSQVFSYSVYFAVITLTTAGLGDYVPTTDANKIICSIFIYFGVACIGLLLGSYIANMLDDRAFREAKKKQIDSCPNCERIKIARDAIAAAHSSPDRKSVSSMASSSRSALHMSMRGFDASVNTSTTAAYVPRNHHKHDKQQTPQANEHLRKPGLDMPSISETHQSGANVPTDPNASPIPPPPPSINTYAPSVSPMANPNILGSPMTRQILGRQRHTRHQSIDATNFSLSQRDRKYSHDMPSTKTPPTISEGAPLHPPISAPQVPFRDARQAAHSLRGSVFLDEDGYASEEDYSDESSVTSASTIAEIVDENATKIKAAKYVFLTLKKALVNSLVIIAVGCVGFIVTEEFNVVDSWYFVSTSQT
jgi:preprotein translocase subunit Sss1